MGTGVELAKQAGGGEAAEIIENFKEQLLIVFLKRLGGEVTIPVAEADNTGGDVLLLEVVGSNFVFKVQQKQ